MVCVNKHGHTYSPHLNHIENSGDIVKARLKKNFNNYPTFDDVVWHVFKLV